MSALEIKNLSKTFSGQVVLDRVSMTVGEGEVHALVGQNGSGKSTLIKVLAGYHLPDDGASATVHDQPLDLGSATDAHRAGIRFVHQDLGLVLELSAVENLMLGRRYPTGFARRIRWREARRLTREMVARAGLDIDVRTPVGELGLADRTRLAIARALPDTHDGTQDDKVVLVLDEPTAALPSRDVERLFTTIRSLQAEGNSIIIVSHHLDEILGVAEMITVLRDGKKVATTPREGLDQESLTHLIIGHELEVGSGRSDEAESGGARLLTLRNLCEGSVDDVSTVVHEGEIVGVAGLAGSGRELLASMITGRLPRSGSVYVGSAPVPPYSPRDSLGAGMAWVVGERARYGTFPNLTVRQNLTMGSLGRHVRGVRIDAKGERGEVREWVDDLGIVTRGVDAPITSLSGGNQQKVLVARALRLSPKVLILDDPTAGIDVAAREQVHSIIENASIETMAVLLVSTDSDELARLCDRVLIMNRGRVTRELRRGVDLTPDAIDHAQVSGVAA